MDVLEVLELGMIGSGGAGRGFNQGLFQLLEFCGCYHSVGHLTAFLVAVIGSLDVSPDGDGSMLS
jgi:hypothetical protein